ncbi:hypothetical protein [Caballeronia sordidicola]|uniref:hypothetical protein n=1 Tax=Caballeronia sordidicola TaxID=196367 RepID=UPI000A3A974A|nr:hypothetical protein [Caballeronia sordidicola]
MVANEADKKARLLDAFAKLTIRDQYRWSVPVVIQSLMQINTQAPETAVPNFSVRGRAAVRKELDDVASTAEKLVSHLDELCEPAFTALADEGLLQMQHRRPSIVLGSDGSRSSNVENFDLQGVLRRVAAMARNARLDDVPESQGRGRPSDGLSLGVSSILAADYSTLTGVAPTVGTKNNGIQDVPYGPFFDLVSDVFAALEIVASPEAAARAAVKRYKETNK